MFKKIYLSVFIFVVVILSLSFFSYLESLEIKKIEISGNQSLEKKELLDFVEKQIEGRYWFLFSKKNILLYPKNKIISGLQKNFLKIKEVEPKRKGGNIIEIKIKEREIFALYCQNQKYQEIFSSESDKKCYFIDRDAFIYTEASNFTKNVYFEYQEEKDLSKDGGNILGSFFLNKDPVFFEKLNLFTRLLGDINIDTYLFYIKNNDDCYLFFDNGSKLIFDKKQNLDVLLENLNAVLIGLGDLGEKEFDYIDLRFDNKIYYKFKKEVNIQIYE